MKTAGNHRKKLQFLSKKSGLLGIPFRETDIWREKNNQTLYNCIKSQPLVPLECDCISRQGPLQKSYRGNQVNMRSLAGALIQND